MQSKGSESEKKRKEKWFSERTKARTRWYSVDLPTSSEKEKIYVYITGSCLVIWEIFQTSFVETLCLRIIHQRKEKRGIYLVDLSHLLQTHWLELNQWGINSSTYRLAFLQVAPQHPDMYELRRGRKEPYPLWVVHSGYTWSLCSKRCLSPGTWIREERK